MPGPIVLVRDGYRLAWNARGSLLPAVLVPFALIWILIVLLQIVISGDEMAIVNGGPQTFTEGFPALVLAVTVLAAWVYCLLSALVALADGSPSRVTWKRAARLTPGAVLGIGLLLAGFGILLLGGAAVDMVLLIAALLVVLYFAGHVLLILPSLASRDSRSVVAVVRGRWWRTSFAALLGALIVPWFTNLGLAKLIAAIHLPEAMMAPLTSALLPLLITAQAGVLAAIYSAARAAESIAEPLDAEPVDAELDAEPPAARDAEPVVVLSGVSTRELGFKRAAALLALVTVAVLTPNAVAAVNPYGVAPLTVRQVDFGEQVTAVGWPQGQRPVIVTSYGFFDCQDDNCSRRERHDFQRPPQAAMTPHGTQAVTSDGVVLSVEYEPAGVLVQRCIRTGSCTKSLVKRNPTGPDYLAIAAGPDGLPYIAVGYYVAPSGKDNGGTHIQLIRCLDTDCARTAQAEIGVAKGSSTRESWSFPFGSGAATSPGGDHYRQFSPMWLEVDAEGRAAVLSMRPYLLIKCDTAECAAPQQLHLNDFPTTARAFSTLRPDLPFGQDVLDMVSQELLRCGGCDAELLVELMAPNPQHGVYAVTRSGTFAIAPHLGPAPPGIHIGQTPRLIRYTLTRCVTAACTGRRTITLNTGPAAHRVWLADNGNGRLLIVEDAAKETTTVTMEWAGAAKRQPTVT